MFLARCRPESLAYTIAMATNQRGHKALAASTLDADATVSEPPFPLIPAEIYSDHRESSGKSGFRTRPKWPQVVEITQISGKFRYAVEQRN